MRIKHRCTKFIVISVLNHPGPVSSMSYALGARDLKLSGSPLVVRGVVGGWRENLVLSGLAYPIPLRYISRRINKLVDGIYDWDADRHGEDGESKSSSILPVVLPREVDKLAEHRVRVLHPPTSRSHR